jgi:hypothetical protein
VPDRLSSLDPSFFALEDAATPMHVGSVMVFDSPEGGFDYDAMVRLIEQRLAFVPRYRQRVRGVLGSPIGMGRRRGLRHPLPRAEISAPVSGATPNSRLVVMPRPDRFDRCGGLSVEVGSMTASRS